MASSFLGTLYNITDMAWIGLLGAKAVAGVGVGGMFTWLSQGLVSLARMGGQVQVAQHIGRREQEEAHGYAQAAVQMAALLGILFAATRFGIAINAFRISAIVHTRSNATTGAMAATTI